MSSKTRVPDVALYAMIICMIPLLVVYYFLNVNLETALLIPSGAAILVYVIGLASGIKLLKKEGVRETRLKVLPWISLAISLIILPFVGIWLVASLVVSLAALIYFEFRKRASGKLL